MSDVNSILEEARIRAASRAAVLQSLQAAYTAPSSSQAKSSNPPSTSNSSKKNSQDKKGQDSNNPSKPNGSNANKKRPLEAPQAASEESLSTKHQVDIASKIVIDSLQTQYYTDLTLQQSLPQSLQDPFCKRPNYDKMNEFFKENLQGKAIVLENTSSQSKANKAESRLRRQKNRLVQLSNRKAKQSHLLDPYLRPSMIEVRLLHHHWNIYLKQVVGKDVSMLGIQLQAKLLSLELKGAKVIVMNHLLHANRQPVKKLPQRSKDMNYTGIVGYITHATSSSYYLAPEMTIASDASKAEQDVLGTLNKSVIRLERDYCDLAVILPRLQSKYMNKDEGEVGKDETSLTATTAADEGKEGTSPEAVEEDDGKAVDAADAMDTITAVEENILEAIDDSTTTASITNPLLMIYGKALHPQAHIAANLAKQAALNSSGNNGSGNSVLVGGSSLTYSKHSSASSCATSLALK